MPWNYYMVLYCDAFYELVLLFIWRTVCDFSIALTTFCINLSAQALNMIFSRVGNLMKFFRLNWKYFLCFECVAVCSMCCITENTAHCCPSESLRYPRCLFTFHLMCVSVQYEMSICVVYRVLLKVHLNTYVDIDIKFLCLYSQTI